MKKLVSFWPIVGVIGLRQVGKSTLLRDQLGDLGSSVTLDDEDIRGAAEASAKLFLAKLTEPALIDEVQKVPKLFDAIKATVDILRKPNRFRLTGSFQFTSRIGIRESLTGRIGLMRLYPLTLSELYEKPYQPKRGSPFHHLDVRFTLEAFGMSTQTGGLPVPAFIRDKKQREAYFQSWVETTVFRDVATAFGRGYDPDFGMKLMLELGRLHREGILPTTTHLKFNTRKCKRYLQAFQDAFLIHKISCHEQGIGKEAFLISDGGIASYLMRDNLGEGASVSLARITILNEILANLAYQGKSILPTYYKSRRGEPVDLIWDNVPIKVVGSTRVNGWDLRSLEGAMQTLKARRGIVASPTDRADLQRSGPSILPWAYWS